MAGRKSGELGKSLVSEQKVFGEIMPLAKSVGNG